MNEHLNEKFVFKLGEKQYLLNLVHYDSKISFRVDDNNSSPKRIYKDNFSLNEFRKLDNFFYSFEKMKNIFLFLSEQFKGNNFKVKSSNDAMVYFYGKNTYGFKQLEIDPNQIGKNFELKEIAKEIVRNDAINKVIIGLDYFDASINRLSAWITGQRAMQKALLFALLINNKELKELQDKADFTSLMVEQEKYKTLPFGAIWEEYLERESLKEDYLSEIRKYEKEVLSQR